MAGARCLHGSSNVQTTKGELFVSSIKTCARRSMPCPHCSAHPNDEGARERQGVRPTATLGGEWSDTQPRLELALPSAGRHGGERTERGGACIDARAASDLHPTANPRQHRHAVTPTHQHAMQGEEAGEVQAAAGLRGWSPIAIRLPYRFRLEVPERQDAAGVHRRPRQPLGQHAGQQPAAVQVTAVALWGCGEGRGAWRS
jgi:hypothetical protein